MPEEKRRSLPQLLALLFLLLKLGVSFCLINEVIQYCVWKRDGIFTPIERVMSRVLVRMVRVTKIVCMSVFKLEEVVRSQLELKCRHSAEVTSCIRSGL